MLDFAQVSDPVSADFLAGIPSQMIHGGPYHPEGRQ
jgi:hypothetical protein